MTETLRERIRAMTERRLSIEDVRRALHDPISETEREEFRSLVRWFTKRYPTPLERLAYVRRAYRRWCGVYGSPTPPAGAIKR